MLRPRRPDALRSPRVPSRGGPRGARARVVGVHRNPRTPRARCGIASSWARTNPSSSGSRKPRRPGNGDTESRTARCNPYIRPAPPTSPDRIPPPMPPMPASRPRPAEASARRPERRRSGRWRRSAAAPLARRRGLARCGLAAFLAEARGSVIGESSTRDAARARDRAARFSVSGLLGSGMQQSTGHTAAHAS